jgi:hypothetical protein
MKSLWLMNGPPGSHSHPPPGEPRDRVTYDSGALIAAEWGERVMWARHRALLLRAETSSSAPTQVI